MKDNIQTTQRLGRHRALPGRVGVLLGALFLAGLAHAQLAIQSITAASQGGSELIRIQTSEPLKQEPKGFVIQSPARIALDFAGATNGLGRNIVELNQGNLRSANVVEAGDRTRVVLNLNQSAGYQTRIDGNALLVVLEPRAAAAAPATKPVFGEGGNADVQMEKKSISTLWRGIKPSCIAFLI